MKPAWLNKKISLRDCVGLREILKRRGLNTVCEEAQCPNIGECFSKRQATFLILGKVCTRGCRFCGVKKGVPLAVDSDEPQRIADCIIELELKHVVITSVTRDDLSDYGAGAFVETIKAIKRVNNKITVEVLIPDFNAEIDPLRLLVESQPNIIAHNLETVPRLYKEVRKGASYERSLKVFNILKSSTPSIPLKSGVMLGLGEGEEEVCQVFDDLVKAGCSYLSIGQYLAPGNSSFPVKEYLMPEIFERYREKALSAGFRFVKSAPYVRSSYMAHEYC
ncbi:MAG: lipoyl synthase [Candidatus Omnitrophota bacterium]|jgi:lipoic acid synthetase|nr:lipoyl synthase [Candidatus Omnitrophota bacterium]